jgi:hypothetical protein
VNLVEQFQPQRLVPAGGRHRRSAAEIGALHLADSTSRNRLGLALYYSRDRFTAVETKAFELKKSLHDRVLTPAHERLIGTRLIDSKDDRELVVASFHAAPLTALNSLRRHQINHRARAAAGPRVPACRPSWSATTTTRSSRTT